MLESQKHDHSRTRLDQTLLRRPFKAQTKWQVITGAPCSGKSTLIGQLAACGLQTAPEAARVYFERELAKGRRIEEIRSHMIECVDGIMRMMLEIEAGLDPDQVIWLDRGYPDCLAFCRRCGLDPNDFLSDCFHHHYASVFLLDRLPIQQDNVRTEDDAAADYLDKWHERDYRGLGYEVVRVPVLAPDERLAYLLEQLPSSSVQLRSSRPYCQNNKPARRAVVSKKGKNQIEKEVP